MLMCIQNLVKFCPLVLKILSGNKNYDGITEFCPLVLKILSGNEILTSIKGRNSVANLQNLTLYNPNIDTINVNVYTKFGLILSIGSQDIERKRNSEINQGP